MLKVERVAVATPAGGAEPALGNDDPLISAPTRRDEQANGPSSSDKCNSFPRAPRPNNTVLYGLMQLLQ
jgi:hypothetical protein